MEWKNPTPFYQLLPDVFKTESKGETHSSQTNNGGQQRFPHLPTTCPINSTGHSAFEPQRASSPVLPVFPTQTAGKQRIRALLLCPARVAFMDWRQNLQDEQDLFFPSGASAALLCCTGTYIVAVIILFEVISYLSYLLPFHRRIELLSVWGQRLHTLSELTAGNLKAFLG